MTPLPGHPFWYLRHGQTDWNAANLAQGAVDIPLNETGRAQAREAAEALADKGIAAIAVSPLARARATAAAVAARTGLTPRILPDLREVAFGVMEGRPMGPWFEEWVAGRATPDGAESFAALRQRATAALAEALGSALGAPGPVLVVAHGSLFRALRAEMGLSPTVRTGNGRPIHCRPPALPGEAWELESLY
ncbi:MAG: histidine phosphatase family protein [Acetobacteraceae bacterium]